MRILSWSGGDFLSSEGTIRLWDAATGQQIGHAIPHDHPIQDALLTEDGTPILSWYSDMLYFWDADTGPQIVPAMKYVRRDTDADFERLGRPEQPPIGGIARCGTYRPRGCQVRSDIVARPTPWPGRVC